MAASAWEMGSPLKQVHLTAGGVQQLHRPVIAASDSGTLAVAGTLTTYLYNRQRSLHSLVTGHDRAVSCVALDKAGELLLTGGTDDLLLVFSVAQGVEVLRRGLGKGQIPRCAGWASSGRKAAVALPSQVAVLGIDSGAVYALSTRVDASCLAWHPSEANVLAVGFDAAKGGVVALLDAVTREETVLDLEQGIRDSIAGHDGTPGCLRALEWDSLEGSFLLAAYQFGGIVLWDVSAGAVLRVFHGSATRGGVSAIHWLPSSPGSFATAHAHSGLVSVWNVSQDAPTATLRAAPLGIHAMAVTAPPPAGTGQTQATSALQPRLREHLHIACVDGTVLTYDCAAGRTTWRSDGGHTDTIFSAAFKPDDPHILATCGFDGHVRLWDATSFTCTTAIRCNPSTSRAALPSSLYCLSWAPAGDPRLLACDGSGCIYVVNVATGAVRAWSHLLSGPCQRVAWSPTRPDLAAATCTHGVCAVFNTSTGKLHYTISLMSPSHAVAWCQVPSSTGSACLLALGHASGLVTLWDAASPGEPVQRLHGHKSAVFHAAFHPLHENILATASNDSTVRVWNTVSGAVMVLRGHSDRARALQWHHEVPHLLLSGSWDGTLRLWDTQSGSCLGICAEHASDVYGIACHPARPNVLVSVSRDSSIRWWQLEGPVSALHTAQIVACGLALGGQSDPPSLWRDALTALDAPTSGSLVSAADFRARASPGTCWASVALSMSLTASDVWSAALGGASSCPVFPHGPSRGGQAVPLLCGTASRALVAVASARGIGEWSSARVRADALRQSMSASTAGEGAADLLLAILACQPGSEAQEAHPDPALVDRVVNEDLQPSGKVAVVPHSLVLDVASAAARSCDVTKATSRVASIGGPRREDLLRSAAGFYLRSGAIEDFCRTAAELGDWEPALALAPAVSHDLWQELLAKRAQSLAGSALSTLAPYLVATGGALQLASQYTGAGLFNHGLQLQHAARYGHFSGLRRVLEPVASAHSGSAAGEPALHAASPDTSHKPQVAADPLVHSVVTPPEHPAVDDPAQATSKVGWPVKAAAWALASGNPGRALAFLLNGNETLAAWTVACALPHAGQECLPLSHRVPCIPVVGSVLPGGTPRHSVLLDPLLPMAPRAEVAHRMCLRCFRHGLWGLGLAALAAFGLSPRTQSLYAARIPLSAGIAALALERVAHGKRSAQSHAKAQAAVQQLLQDFSSPATPSTDSDTTGCLAISPPGAGLPSHPHSLQAFAAQCLSQRAPRSASALSTALAKAPAENEGVAALQGMTALYEAAGLQPRLQALDEAFLKDCCTRGDPSPAAAMLLRAGEHQRAATLLVTALANLWAGGLQSWWKLASSSLTATLAAVGVAQLPAPPAGGGSGDVEDLPWFDLRAHPSHVAISQLSQLLGHLPCAALEPDLRDAVLTFLALFGAFHAMSLGASVVLRPQFALVRQHARTAGLPVPTQALALVEAAYLALITGDWHGSLALLQRHTVAPDLAIEAPCIPPCPVELDPVDQSAFETAFAVTITHSVQLAGPFQAALTARVAARERGTRERPPSCGSVCPASLKHPQACRMTGSSASQLGPGAAAAGSPERGPTSAISSLPVRSGLTRLDSGLVAAEAEAVAWARVNAMSPSATGQWMIPF